jgi:hypothetical protein
MAEALDAIESRAIFANGGKTTTATARTDGGHTKDHFAAHIWLTQGYNTLPQEIDRSEIAQYLKAGERGLCRSVGSPTGPRLGKAAPRPIDQFKYGVSYAGIPDGHSYGYGIYTYIGDPGREADVRSNWSSYGGGNSNQWHGTLKADARTLTQRHANKLRRELAIAMKLDTELSKRKQLISILENDDNTVGWVAALYGYDGYETNNPPYFVLLNRGAVRVVKQDLH